MLHSGALGVAAGLLFAGILVVVVPSLRGVFFDDLRQFLDELKRMMD